MDICLVLPLHKNNNSLTSTLAGAESLGLGYLASCLKKENYSVEIINCEHERLSYIELLNKLIRTKPRIIAISPVSSNMSDTLILTKNIKNCIPNSHIVLGGHHVTPISKEIIISESSINSVLRGEGEKSIVHLANFIIRDIGDISKIEGVTTIYNEKLIEGEKQLIEKIDEIPYPTRLVMKQKSNLESIEVRLLTSRGCVGACSFCSSPNFYNQTWRARNYISVVDEMEYLMNCHGVSHFWITDDTYIISTVESQNRANKIAEEILARNLKLTYRILCRADSFTGIEDMIPLLRKSGLTTVFVGLESASDGDLKLFNKGLKSNMNYSIIELMHDNNIETQIGFIMFNPYSSFSDLRSNCKLLYSIGELYRVLHLTRAVDIFPGTSLLNRLIVDDMLLDNNNYYKMNEYIKYRFVDANVKKIYDIITVLYDENIEQMDAKLLDLKFKTDKMLSSSKDIVLGFFRDLNDINYEFISNLFDHCEISKELDAEYINIIKVERENRIINIVKKIEKYVLKDGFNV